MERSPATACVVLLELCVIVLSAVPGVLSLPSCSTSQNSTCLLSHSCSTDHSNESQLLKCSKEIRSIDRPATSPTRYKITECSRYSSTFGFKHCANRTNVPDNEQFLVKRVEGQIMPVNVSHFAVTVNWEWYENDYDNSRNKLEGYELRVLEDNIPIKCLCIREPMLLSVSLGLDDAFQYYRSANSKMTIEVATFPYNANWDRKFYARSSISDWPAVCLGSPVCLFGLPPAPVISNATSVSIDSDLRELQLSWTKPASHVNTYYIQLSSKDLNESLGVFVNGTNSVNISGLHSSIAWSVRVQGYSPCSGLASYYSGVAERIGCGELSMAKKVTELTLPLPFWSSTLPYTANATFHHNHHITFVTISTAMVLFLLVALATILTCIYFHLRNTNKNSKATIIYKDMEIPVITVKTAFNNEPAKVDVLVLYSLSTPTQEKIEIEKYIVGVLKQKQHNFKVISCNDHTEKTVVQWVEENARLAHVVFIVCNKQFSLDWKMKKRPQLINALENIVASAVGQNKIKKYATVLLRPGNDMYIPDNLYIKGMKSFVMGPSATHEEKARFVGFINLTSAMP